MSSALLPPLSRRKHPSPCLSSFSTHDPDPLLTKGSALARSSPLSRFGAVCARRQCRTRGGGADERTARGRVGTGGDAWGRGHPRIPPPAERGNVPVVRRQVGLTQVPPVPRLPLAPRRPAHPSLAHSFAGRAQWRSQELEKGKSREPTARDELNLAWRL